MALAKDLMQVGIPAEAATRLGFTIGSGAAAGTTQGTAAAIGAGVTLFTITAGAASAGVILNAATEVGQEVIIGNAVGNAVNVYAPTGGSINGLAANAAFAIPANDAVHFIRTGTNTWIMVT